MQSSKHHDSQFEVHTLPDWQPMELLQNWRDVLMSSHTSDQTRRGVLDGLYASEQVVGDAVQKRIAVVQAVRDKRLDQSLSSIRRQRPDNRTQLPKLKKNPERQTALTCADMVSSESRTTPRSRAVLTVETDAFNIATAWTSIFPTCCLEPSQITTVFDGFKRRRLELIQAAMSVIQLDSLVAANAAS